MTIYKVKTNTLEETIKLATDLSQYLDSGDVITLEGQLGTGKTTFVKGIAAGLGITENVTSPTFTIIKEYNGHFPLYHMDAYRLEHSEEDIGFEEYINGDGVTVIEWAHFIEDFLPNDRLNIRLSYEVDDTRMISFEPVGKHYKKIINKLSN